MVASEKLPVAVAIVLAVMLAGCGAPGSSPTPAASTTPMAATVVPTATLHAETVEIGLETMGDGAELLGLLVNQSDNPVEHVALQLLDSSGARVGGRATTALPWIAAGGASPFVVSAPGDLSLGDLSVSIAGYEPAERTPLPLEIEWASHSALPGGGERWAGWIVSGSTPARIDGIAAIGGGSLAQIVAAPGYLIAGQPAPLEITLPESMSPTSIETFLSASPATLGPVRVEARLEPGWQVDPQGGPFIAGSLVNRGRTPALVGLLLGLEQDGILQRAVAINSDIPLMAGEIRPFGIRLDRMPWPTADLPDLLAFVEAAPLAAAQIEPLTIVITGTETPGRSILLIGSARNDSAVELDRPMAFVALRGDDGSLWTAAWRPLASALDAGESVDFVIELPLGVDVDPRLGEWDVRALGLAVE